jgi:hypothetical protein
MHLLWFPDGRHEREPFPRRKTPAVLKENESKKTAPQRREPSLDDSTAGQRQIRFNWIDSWNSFSVSRLTFLNKFDLAEQAAVRMQKPVVDLEQARN